MIFYSLSKKLYKSNGVTVKQIQKKREKLFAIKDVEQAIKEMNKFLKKRPMDTAVRLRLALRLISSDTQRLSNMAKAENHLRVVTALDPKNEIAFFHLGLAIQTQGKRGSKKFFKKAIKIKSNYEAAHYTLSKEYFIENKFDKAAIHLKKALELAPENKIYQKEYDDLKLVLKKYMSKNKQFKANRWPVMHSDFSNLSEAITKYIVPELEDMPTILNKKSNVVTLGSCFAGNLARVLRKQNVNAENITIGEYINSTYANKTFLNWVNGTLNDEHLSQKMELIFEQEASYYKNLIMNADILIFTLGVAPAFFDRSSKKFVMPRASQLSLGALKTKYEFRTTTVEENTENLDEIIQILKDLSGNKKIILTLSPVPLSVTFEKKSAVIADCLSKSVLRSSIENVIQKNNQDIYYWPSFEIVRWIGSYRGDGYGQDDGSSHHVSEAYIDKIISTFINAFGDEEFINFSKC
ncbi:GSCFA domain-containing protein [Sulfurimonas sp. NW7]|uniref:GSCFA domain-containing protein n=1 Tax=Sulfurimonas sp. NW7 TaxID=2922727 RepID=UPI003DA9322F